MDQHRPVGEGPPVGVVVGGAGRRVDGQGVVDGAEKIAELLGRRCLGSEIRHVHY
jgi:hypothetical protein